MTAAAAVDALLAAVETVEEGEILKELLVRADLAKECTECEELYRTAGVLCISCRAAHQRKVLDSGEARWTLGYEGEGDPDAAAWTLRHGVGADTTIFAVEATIDPDDREQAQEWGAGVLERDHGVKAAEWVPVRDSPPFTQPQYWVAVPSAQ
jgi:hypothetical protein